MAAERDPAGVARGRDGGGHPDRPGSPERAASRGPARGADPAPSNTPSRSGLPTSCWSRFGAGVAGGPDALRHWRHLLPDADAVVVRVGDGDVKTAEWLRAGAFAVVGRPVEPDELAEELERAAERVRLRVENRQLRRQLDAPRRFPAIVGQSKKMLELLRAGRRGRRQRRQHPRARRQRHGQGTDCQCRARAQRPCRRPLRQDQLRGPAQGADRGRIVRLSAWRLHRRVHRQGRAAGDGRGRVAAARRDRRDAVVPAGQAAARAAGTRVPADRQRSQCARRFPADLRDQRRRGVRPARGTAARGPLLPHQHHHRARAGAARAARGRGAALPAFPYALQRRVTAGRCAASVRRRTIA